MTSSANDDKACLLPESTSILAGRVDDLRSRLAQLLMLRRSLLRTGVAVVLRLAPRHTHGLPAAAVQTRELEGDLVPAACCSGCQGCVTVALTSVLMG